MARKRLLAAHSHHDLPHRGLHGGGGPPRRGPRGRLRPPERDGGRVPRSPPDLAVRRPGRRRAPRCAAYAARRPLDAVVPVDDVTAVAGAAIGERPRASRQPRGRGRGHARQAPHARAPGSRRGVPAPAFASFRVDDDPRAAARRVRYPCVLKPLVLSASRGVIRADDAAGFVAAFRRIAAILASPDVAGAGRGRPSASSSRTSCRASRSRSRAPRGRRARDAGALRQAGPARRARSSRRRSTSRRRACPRRRRRRSGTARRRRRERSASTTARSTPSCGCDRTTPAVTGRHDRDRGALDRRPLLAHAHASARACRSRRSSCATPSGCPSPSLERERRGRGRDDDPDPRGRRARGGRGPRRRPARCRSSRTW